MSQNSKGANYGTDRYAFFCHGAFTHSRFQIDTLVKYILTREEHHKKKPFKEEYLEMLEKNNVEFNRDYLFEFFSDIYEWD